MDSFLVCFFFVGWIHTASGAHSGIPGSSTKGDDAAYSWSEEFYHAPNLGYWSGKVRQQGCVGCGNSWIAVTPEAEQMKPLPGEQITNHAIMQLNTFAKQHIGITSTFSAVDAVDAVEKEKQQPFFLAVGFHKPHLPFVAPERFFQSYPMDEIQLPKDQNPPTNMPSVAWSSWGELRAYLDIAALVRKKIYFGR